jgi:hypothetical protein
MRRIHSRCVSVHALVYIARACMCLFTASRRVNRCAHAQQLQHCFPVCSRARAHAQQLQHCFPVYLYINLTIFNIHTYIYIYIIYIYISQVCLRRHAVTRARAVTRASAQPPRTATTGASSTTRSHPATRRCCLLRLLKVHPPSFGCSLVI